MEFNSTEPSGHMQALDRLHQGVIVELIQQDKTSFDPRGGANSRASVNDAQIRSEVDRAMLAIRSAGTNIGALSEKSRSYEENIRELKKTISELRSAHEALSQKSAKAELRIRQEAERAQQAEARVRLYEGQIKQMELREKTIMGNLDRVMKLVDATFGLPERAPEQGLRSAI